MWLVVNACSSADRKADPVADCIVADCIVADAGSEHHGSGVASCLM